MTKLMKIKSLKNYGIPSYILNIWEEHYSPYLLPIQADAVRNYGVLDYEQGRGYEIAALSSKARNNNDNLLVIAPTSSGKTLIGEMAAINQIIHSQKIIYLVPLRSLAEEKYRHFKNLYNSCGLDIAISTRDRSEDDYNIISGDYMIAVMVYEKFHYFRLQYPHFLECVSLVIIDEMQLINNPKWGPLLESIVSHIQKKYKNPRIIALSALIENQEALLKWFPAQTLLSYQRPAELRKGIVREGVFKYITSKNKKTCKKEVFFKPEAVRDNCFEDYLLETVRYLVNQDEPTLIFFATCAETRKWAKWLASQLESPAASLALKELKGMEETSSRNELLKLLEKGIAYHNQDLSWEERNLIETYLKKGEIKIICATTILVTGINLPSKNVIVPLDKIYNDEEDYPHNYRTSITFADIKNMGGRTGTLGFGRVIFLAHSLLCETTYQKLYFNFFQNNNHNRLARTKLVKEEEDLLTFLLRLLVDNKCRADKIREYINLKETGSVFLQSQDKQGKSEFERENALSGYWQFNFDKDNISEKISHCLDILKENKLIREDKKGILSPTASGILVAAKRIKVETYLFLKTWMKYSKKGEISDLEILFLLSLSPDGKELAITSPQSYRNDDKRERYNYEGEEIYQRKMLHLVFNQGDEDKKIYRDKLILKDEEADIWTLDDYLASKKTLLLYDWIESSRDIKNIEEEYNLYKGSIIRLAEGFSWLTYSLATIAENACWKKERKGDLKKIRILSKRLVESIKEEGLSLARTHIPGLSRGYIRKSLREGYSDEKCLEEASEEELKKLLPQRLVKRIKKKMKEEKDNQEVTEQKLKVKDEKLMVCKEDLETENLPTEPSVSSPVTLNTNDSRLTTNSPRNSQSETRNLQPVTVLEIDIHRPDRIIFQGKEVKISSKGFSLLYLLAQHKKEVVSYNNILDEIWKGDEDAIYSRIIQHIYKFRRDILDAIGNSKKNKEKINNIFKVVSGRGVMLNIDDKELKIN